MQFLVRRDDKQFECLRICLFPPTRWNLHKCLKKTSERMFLTYFLLLLGFASLQTVWAAPVGNCNDDFQNVQAPPAKQRKLDGPRCEILFSELKFSKSSEDEGTFPFIELKTTCKKRPGTPPKNPFSSYKLIIVSGNPLAIHMLVDFAHFPFEDSKHYITIGSPRVPNVDISLSSPHIQSSYPNTVDHKMLPSLNDPLFSIMIISDVARSESRPLNLWVNELGTMSPRILSTQAAKLIVSKITDMVLVGAPSELATTLYSPFWRTSTVNTNAMHMTELNSQAETQGDTSLSICNEEYRGFDSSLFEIRPESPGLPNYCQNGETNANNAENCNVRTSQSPLLHTINENQMHEIRRNFDESHIPICQDHFPKGESLLTSMDTQKWLRFETEPTLCKFTCAACKSYFAAGFRPDVKRKSFIVKDGYLSNNIYSNRDVIKTHSENHVHLEALKFYDRLKASNSEQDITQVIQEFEDSEKETFNATMNVVLFVYAEMKAGVSFKSHETFMKTLQLMGSNVGWLQHTGEAAQLITKVISKALHWNLLEQLVSEQLPFSILVDSSTNSNQPFLAVYFQTLKGGHPYTYFYSLIPMDEGEKARDMTDSLIAQIQADSVGVLGFEDFFKSKITSISSDGAAVMVADGTSFKAFLIQYIHRTIPNVVCLAHNLDRAYKTGIQQDKNLIKDLDHENGYDEAKLWQLTYFEKFDKSTNELYTFYASRGYKRWQHFLKTAEDSDLVPKRLKYVYDIRWSESHFRSLESIHHNYYSLVEDLDQICVSKDFDKSAKKTAINFYQRMTDKTYLLVLHDFLDLLYTFKIASKLFQESSSIVVGKIRIVQDILTSLQEFKDAPGKFLQDFLENVICFGECDEGDCRLEEYEACEETLIRGMKLEHQYPVVLPYVDVRQITYSNMIASVKKYFKLDLLDSFELFNPQCLNFRQDESFSDLDVHTELSIEIYYHNDDANGAYHFYDTYIDRTKFICQFYNLNEDSCTQFMADWNPILGCVVSNPELQQYRESDATVFWPQALRRCDRVWTPLARDLVNSVLVTSYSSSECERGFSIMNGIKTKSRSSLEKSTLDAIMRVKINGPEIENFNSYKFTIEEICSCG